MFGEIVWVCDRCLRMHKWDLLSGDATSVLKEK